MTELALPIMVGLMYLGLCFVSYTVAYCARKGWDNARRK